MSYVPYLLVAYTTYLVGTASPGPANLAIMATAMDSGRRAALAFALGVVSGSQAWGVLSAFGIGAVLMSYGTAMSVLKVIGGLYLLWLAYRALRVALSAPTGTSLSSGSNAPRSGAAVGLRHHYLRGLSLHLTNPKAILVWFTTISLGMPPGAPSELTALIVLGCGAIAIMVFCIYAWVFSTKAMIQLYVSYRPAINGVLVLVFAMAGLKLILEQF